MRCAESWQEMAAVLDMLQDMSEATDSMPQNPDGSLRPASAQAPLSSPSQTFRCASAHTPALLKAAQSQSYASMPNTPVAAAWADSKQSVLIKGQHPLSARCKSASNHSRMGSAQKSGSREHPLSARGGKRQPANNREWQT